MGDDGLAYDNLPPLRDIIATHNLSASRKFGQNFILDLNITRRIAQAAGDLTNCDIIEIGAGPGGLTRSLLAEGARKLIVIEADRRFIPALEQIAAAYPNRLEIIIADALKLNPNKLTPHPYRIVANLPYNIATPLLINWLYGGFDNDKWAPRFKSLTLMFQKEVANRIIAQCGTKNYGRLSVLTNWLAQTRKIFEVDKQVFVPPPKVTSALVEVIPRATPIAATPDMVAQITRAAFGQRRKMLRVALKQICSDPRALLAQAKLDETIRAEEVDISGFCSLANLIADDKTNKGD